jgi:hypothetical protein
VLPSVPVTVTWVEFVAVTVKTDEFPAMIAVGFAIMVTVGRGLGVTVTVVLEEVFPPAPVADAV